MNPGKIKVKELMKRAAMIPKRALKKGIKLATNQATNVMTAVTTIHMYFDFRVIKYSWGVPAYSLSHTYLKTARGEQLRKDERGWPPECTHLAAVVVLMEPEIMMTGSATPKAILEIVGEALSRAGDCTPDPTKTCRENIRDGKSVDFNRINRTRGIRYSHR